MNNQEKIYKLMDSCLTGSLSIPRWQACTCLTVGQLLVLLNISYRSFTSLLTSMFSDVSRVRSWSPSYSHRGWTCFFRGVTWWASQLATTHTPVKPRLLRSSTQLATTATTGSSVVVGSSDQVLLNSGSQPMKGGRLGSMFSHRTMTYAIP
jgi:hypothetical protein